MGVRLTTGACWVAHDERARHEGGRIALAVVRGKVGVFKVVPQPVSRMRKDAKRHLHLLFVQDERGGLSGGVVAIAGHDEVDEGHIGRRSRFLIPRIVELDDQIDALVAGRYGARTRLDGQKRAYVALKMSRRRL